VASSPQSGVLGQAAELARAAQQFHRAKRPAELTWLTSHRPEDVFDIF